MESQLGCVAHKSSEFCERCRLRQHHSPARPGLARNKLVAANFAWFLRARLAEETALSTHKPERRRVQSIIGVPPVAYFGFASLMKGFVFSEAPEGGRLGEATLPLPLQVHSASKAGRFVYRAIISLQSNRGEKL